MRWISSRLVDLTGIKNINFSNFKFKSNLIKKKNLLKKINNKNIFIELPLLKSLTKEYQMEYDRSLIKSLKNYKKIYKIVKIVRECKKM